MIYVNFCDMKEKLFKALRFLVFLCIGLVLFWLVYKDQPMDDILDALKKADYTWIIVSLVLALFSHISRAVRWNILIHSLGYKPKLANTLSSVLIMYLSNTAIPRSGEIARCGVMKKYEDVPFSKLLGTVVVERAIDFLMLFILLAIVLLTQFHVILEFLDNHPEVSEKFAFLSKTTNLLIIAGFAIAFLLALFLLRNKMKSSIFYLKVKDLIKNFWEGIKTVKSLEKKWWFIFHSLSIWILYFMMIYITFWSFNFTEHLTMLTGLTVFVMASFGMVAPSPGGIGTWHFMVIETLVIYGVERTPDANAFAFAAHGSMTLFLIIIGLISVALLPIINKKKVKALEAA